MGSVCRALTERGREPSLERGLRGLRSSRGKRAGEGLSPECQVDGGGGPQKSICGVSTSPPQFFLTALQDRAALSPCHR